MGKCNQELLAERTRNIPLYLHAYAFHLSMHYEKVLSGDPLDIAYQQKLKGVKIHVENGKSQSLQKLNDQQLHDFKKKAREYNLDVHTGTSASDKATLMDAIRIAVVTGATSVCFYPRYEGYLNDVMVKITNDTAWLSQYDDCGLSFTIEQHEDLQGHELATLVNNSGIKNLFILLDFGNMINANEQLLSALEVMSPLITQVHIKDAKIIEEGRDWGYEACRPGYGDLPMKGMFKVLLLLGEDKPQVHAFGLEEEIEYYASAFRLDDEDDNPWIPWRDVSHAPLPDSNTTDTRLVQGREHALAQIEYTRDICDKFIGNQLVFLKYY